MNDLGSVLSALLVPYLFLGVPLSALLTYARREPVRVAAILLAAVLVAVSIVTGTSIVVLLGEVAGVVGLFEKVRSQVTPMVDVVVHPADAADKAV